MNCNLNESSVALREKCPKREIFSIGSIPMRLAVEESPALIKDPAPDQKEQAVQALAPSISLPQISEGILDESEEAAKKILQIVESVQNWVSQALAQLEKFRRADRVIQEQPKMAKEIAENKATLEKLLYAEPMPAYRRAAWLAAFNFFLSQELKTPEEATGLIDQLTKKGFLEETANGPVAIGWKNYSISPKSCFGEQEIGQIAAQIQGMAVLAEKKCLADLQKRSDELLSQSEMSVLELADADETKKTGLCAMRVPARQRGDGVWMPGGTIMVEATLCSDKKIRIYPILAVGKPNFERAFKGVIDNNVFLLPKSLKWDNPPRLQESIREDQSKSLRLLWFLIKRGLDHAIDEENVRNKKNEYLAKTNVSSEQFFLEGKPGICLAQLEGTYKPEGKPKAIDNLFFLVERVVVDKNYSGIRVVETPKHISELFVNCKTAPLFEGKNFDKLPFPLRSILLSICKQVQKGARIAEAQAATSEE